MLTAYTGLGYPPGNSKMFVLLNMRPYALLPMGVDML